MQIVTQWFKTKAQEEEKAPAQQEHWGLLEEDSFSLTCTSDLTL